MDPEQAGGKRALVGPASDIYALGAVLYQLLTGQLPFQRDSTLEMLRAVTTEEPTRPRRLQPRIPRDLEAITLHCLEKEPGRRYPSAVALAEDLRRFQNGEQVEARAVGSAARLARACRRRPLVAALLALLTLSVLGGLGGITWKWLDANEQRDLANSRARQADDEKQAATYQAYRASLAAATAALEIHDVADAARHLRSAPDALRGWEWRHLSSRLDDSASVIPLPASGNRFRIVGGGLLIASRDQLRVGVLTDAGLHVTDLDGGEHGTLPIGPEHRHHVDVAQTSRGLRVAAWVGETAFDVLDGVGQVVCRVTPPQTHGFDTVVFSPDGARLCVQTRGEKYRLAVFDATNGKRMAMCDGHRDGIWVYAFSPDSSRIASGGEDSTARLWDAATGKLLATCEGHTSKVLGLAFSRDGSRLVTTSADGTVRQWKVESGREVEPPYDRHSGEVFSAAYSPDGKWIASAGDDRTVRVWRARGRQDVAILHGHTGRVVQVAFDPDGRRLASLSRPNAFVSAGDDTVRVWDVAPDATLPVLRGHTNYVYPVVYSPDGRWLASGSWDKTVRLWDAETGELCATLPHPGVVMDLAFGPDGTWLITGCKPDDRLRIWDVATARVRRTIPLRDPNVYSVTVSPDGTRVAVTTGDQDAGTYHRGVYDVGSRELLFMLDGWSLAYSPDGRWLAALPADGKTVLLLDARTHETVARFGGHDGHVFKAAFSPDSRYLASCSEDRTVRVWPVDGGACRELRGHTDEVYAVAFHPDGMRLAAAGRDGAVWLWDLGRDEAVARLPGHKDYVWSLAFSPDGTTLASGSGDFTVRLWDTAPLKTRYDARRAAAALHPEAARLVDRLWRQTNDPAAVVASLRADPALGEPLRHEAFREVLRRTGPPEGAGFMPK
jgi:WD40 repeat protein